MIEKSEIFNSYEIISKNFIYDGVIKGYDSAFETFYIPLLSLFRKKIKQLLYGFENKAIYNIENSIRNRLHTIADRILIREMNILKNNYKLVGNNENEEYKYFVYVKLVSFKYITYIYGKYNELLECVTSEINNAILFWKEIVDRIYNDRDKIVFICDNKNFEKIKNVYTGIADYHNGGRTVVVFSLDNGHKIVYKPRSLKNEIKFNQILKKLYYKCGIDFYDYIIVDKEQYGWCQHIKENLDIKGLEISKFCYRMGINLFAAYILGSSDLHFDNLIIHGVNPVFIDLECIFGAIVSRKLVSLMESNYKIEKTVLNSGILPVLIKGEELGLTDNSAMGNYRKQRFHIKTPSYMYYKTSKMQVVYERPFVEMGNKLFGKYIFENASYKMEVIKGFQNAYQVVLESKKQIYKFLNQMKNVESRIILRDTQQYHMLLTASFHPDAFIMGRERFLKNSLLRISSQNKLITKSIINEEIRSLANGDIPYFKIKANKRAVYGGSSKIYEPKFFSDAPYNFIVKDLERMNDSDLNIQTNIIRLSIELEKETKETLHNGSIQSKNTYKRVGENEVKDLIKECIHIVSQLQFLSDDRLHFLGSNIVDNPNLMWTLNSVNNYLYSGCAGVAIFLAAYKKIDNSNTAKEMMDKVINRLFFYTETCIKSEENTDSTSTGILDGESSVCYAYQVLYRITKEENYLKYAVKHAIVVEKMIEKDMQYDLIYGNAGAIIMFLNLSYLTGEKEYIKIAERAANVLINNYVIDNLSDKIVQGVSHGNSGFILAFVMLYAKTQKKVYKDTLLCLLVDEKEYLMGHCNSKQDMFKSADESWCHGVIGILMTRVKAFSVIKDVDIELAEQILIEINWLWDQFIVNIQARKGQCLCHGNLGIYEILKLYEVLIKHKSERVSEVADLFINHVLATDMDRWLFQEKKNVGFMSGISGIGYSLIRLLNQDIPMILCLDI